MTIGRILYSSRSSWKLPSSRVKRHSYPSNEVPSRTWKGYADVLNFPVIGTEIKKRKWKSEERKKQEARSKESKAQRVEDHKTRNTQNVSNEEAGWVIFKGDKADTEHQGSQSLWPDIWDRKTTIASEIRGLGGVLGCLQCKAQARILTIAGEYIRTLSHHIIMKSWEFLDI